ncbi:MAG TPA: AAA family ATPase [Streptosporangiaceae bacterium]
MTQPLVGPPGAPRTAAGAAPIAEAAAGPLAATGAAASKPVAAEPAAFPPTGAAEPHAGAPDAAVGPSVSAEQRRLVLVSGPPGSGKSTLAGPLAAELGFALLAKDRIKETLHDWLGQASDLVWSRRLGAAAMELLWALAADAPAVVLEANFWPGDTRVTSHLRELCASPVEVYCQCPEAECVRRYAARASSRHEVHVISALSPEAFEQCSGPVGLGPIVDVDTTRPVDIVQVAREVLRLLPATAAP